MSMPLNKGGGALILGHFDGAFAILQGDQGDSVRRREATGAEGSEQHEDDSADQGAVVSQ
jgi:hypothetical protein